MGHPPEDDFVAGAHCANFEAAFGTTETPLTVKCVLEGITKCPLYPNPPINGSFILPRMGVGCIWRLIFPDQDIVWSLDGGGTMQVIDLRWPRGTFFIAAGLTDFYNNLLSCPGQPAGGGTATITWGPEIPKL